MLGHDLRQHPATPAGVAGFVDAPGLYPSLAARRNLRELNRLQGRRPGAGVADALDRVDLSDVADDRIRGFSLGMRQRLGLAAAMLGEPQLLVLDEPVNGLDPAARRQVHDVVADLAARGCAVVVTSHRMEDLERICSEVTILDRGRVAWTGTLAGLAARDDDLDHRLVTTDPGHARAVAAVSGCLVTTTDHTGALVVRGPAARRDELVLMVETGRDPVAIERAFAEMQARRVDALVLGIMDSRHVELPAWKGPRPVVVNGTADGCRSVLPDESAAGEAAVNHLVTHGHRRIGFIGRHAACAPGGESVNAPVRTDAIDRAMARAGLEFSAVHCDALWEPSTGRTGTHAVLDEAPDTTAILAANDRIAFGVYQALAERGLRVGDDVSVMSFDDEQLASLVLPGLTTMRLPYPEMGRTGVELTLDSPDDATGSTTLLPMPLVERASVTWH